MATEVMSDIDSTESSQRIIFLVLFAINFCISFGFGMTDSFFSVYYQELGAGTMLIGVSAASYQISKIFLGPATGRAEAAHGSGGLMFLSLAAYLFVAVSLMTSTNIYYIVLLRFIQGAACAAFKPSIYSILNSTLPREKRGEAFGSFDVSFYVAIAIGPAAGGVIISHFGYMGLFSVLLCICSLVAIAGYLFLKLGAKRKTVESMPLMVGRPCRTEIGLYTFIIGKSAIIACFTVYFPIYLLKNSNFSAAKVGMMMSLSMIVMAMLLKPMGRLADKWHKIPMVAIGGVLSSLVYLVMPETFSTSSAVLFAVFSGVAGAVSQPAGVTLLMHCSDDGIAPASIMGRFNSVMSVGSVLGTLACSFFAGWLSLRAAFVYAGWTNLAMVLISVVILLGVDSGDGLNMVEHS